MTVLPTYRMLFEPLPDGDPEKDLGLRSKLGGSPNWEQGDETPACPHCKKRMVFVGQLDSIHHDDKKNPHRIGCLTKNQKYMFGDVGLIYLFFCFECLEPRAVFQCG
jgi:uncharacterized protein YwqG